MTVFFCDIEGFTRLSEQLPPERLVQLLNEYLTEMTDVVRSTARAGGQVHRRRGDGLLGRAVRTDRHAHLACEAALKMRAVLLEHQDVLGEEVRPPPAVPRRHRQRRGAGGRHGQRAQVQLHRAWATR